MLTYEKLRDQNSKLDKLAVLHTQIYDYIHTIREVCNSTEIKLKNVLSKFLKTIGLTYKIPLGGLCETLKEVKRIYENKHFSVYHLYH